MTVITGEIVSTRDTTPRCGAKKHQGEGTCQQAAGWGTDHVGYGACKLHGGATPNARYSAHKQRAYDITSHNLPQLADAKPVENPLELLAKLTGLAVEWTDRISKLVDELDQQYRYAGEGMMGEQLRAEVALLERGIDRVGKLAVDMAKLNIDERLVAIEERKADMLATALAASLAKAGIPLAVQNTIKQDFVGRLRITAEPGR